MTDEEFQSYLDDRFEDQRGYYDRRSVDFKNYYYYSQFVIIFFGALTPVLVALSDKGTWGYWYYAPIVASFLVAVAAGLQAAFKYQETWIRYRATVQTLERTKGRFDGGVGAFKEEDVTAKRRKFVEQVERVLAAETNSWVNSFDGPGDDS